MTNTIEISSHVLKCALKAVAPYMSKDQTRVHLNAVRLELSTSTGVKLVATDGHGLAIAQINRLQVDGLLDAADVAVQINSEDVKAIIKMLGKAGSVRLDFTAATLSFTYDGSGRVCILADDEQPFPQYELVIPNKRPSLDGAVEIPRIGLDPVYLLRVGNSCAAFAGGKVAASSTDLRMQCGKPLEPIVYTCENSDFGTLVQVLMPRRIN